MTDESPWARNEVESPCVKICVVHPQARICTGCLRSIDEITRWTKMAPDERRAIMEALPDRASLLRKRRGGRAARVGEV
ncbi:conserved hypothetical protein [Roseovarius sp. EC-HK134]|jgi:predicted Fe-S protein YdhL (DUF1289 family)|uniref:Fe-S protein n=1 Tax=Roseovarius mucosus TaxID=215743 RepID=A0A1V0RLG4_9RHOB|nr:MULTISPECIES: DUF1289 domain-containing protein [Roseovarius]MBS4010065.1 DUF1289 domain-containing protein [Roseovarius sp.]ARE82571.1 hypothetical protein ROSMUCSMR3_01076 [Roseovarius mucosus]MBW4973713.1 DUF1289 domain-containing protein [Roseovarius mucosus]VVT33578.1 conserved hypothetical protein [Roseovarius sp. EC-HK134]VVT33757.1 conserved hypothetical protein [Roseovarius sp. EC-SD190]